MLLPFSSCGAKRNAPTVSMFHARNHDSTVHNHDFIDHRHLRRKSNQLAFPGLWRNRLQQFLCFCDFQNLTKIYKSWFLSGNNHGYKLFISTHLNVPPMQLLTQQLGIMCWLRILFTVLSLCLECRRCPLFPGCLPSPLPIGRFSTIYDVSWNWTNSFLGFPNVH